MAQYREGQTATLPDGSKAVFQGGNWVAAAAPKLTEDQGKTGGSARLMADAEASYDRAVGEGYKPGSIRNSIAAGLEGLPLGGLDGLGALVRDDVSDRGRQAELQWSDAQLRNVSGASAREEEIKRGVRTYFPRPFENVGAVGEQKRHAREVAFEGAKVRAGPGVPGLAYPAPQIDRSKLPTRGGGVAGPTIGEVRKGYRFLGGDPAKQGSWAAAR